MSQKVALLVPVQMPREMSMGKWSGTASIAHQLQHADGRPLGVGLFETKDAARRWAGNRWIVREAPARG